MTRRIVFLALGLCTLLAGTARANSLGTVEMRYSSAAPARTARIYLDGSISNLNVYTGQYNLLLNPNYQPTGEGQGIYDAAENGIIGAFCSDVHQYAPTGSTFRRYDVLYPEGAPIGGANDPDGMGIDKADDLRWLFALFGGEYTDGSGDDNDDAAAFALCVWEIIFETRGQQYDVSDPAARGAFYTTSGIGSFADTANQWLDVIEAISDPAPDIALRILGSEGCQDYGLVASGTGGNPAPEPLTMVGVFLGVCGLVAPIRRRLRPGRA